MTSADGVALARALTDMHDETSAPSDHGRRLVEQGFDRPTEAAAFLGISRSHLYGLMERGDLVFAKFGKSRRIPRVALIEYAARQLVLAQAEHAAGKLGR